MILCMQSLQGHGFTDQSKSSESEAAQIPGLNYTEKNADDGSGSKKLGSKHPLRIPGMRPSEDSFICKGTDHIGKLCPTEYARDRKKICWDCRKIGHTLKKLPSKF